MSQSARAFLISAILAFHILGLFVHRIAHRELRIYLEPWEHYFVWIVVVFVPIVAAALAWTVYRRWAYVVFGTSMLAACIFGLAMHFFVLGDDNIRYLPPLEYQRVFIFSAIGLAGLEALGAFMGGYALWVSYAGPAPAKPKKKKRRIETRLD